MKDRENHEINEIRQGHGNKWNHDHPDVIGECAKRSRDSH
jgi:hypothetical protein